MIVNGEFEEINEKVKLIDYLEMKELDYKKIVIELNNSIIKKSEYQNITLANNDKLEIVCFVGGG